MDLSGIYEDLNDLSIGDKLIKAQEENKKLLQHIEVLEGDISKLCKELIHMKERESNLKKNISELFNTAMVETNRKQRIINDLQTEIDNLNMMGRRNSFRNSSYKRNRDNDVVICTEPKKLKPDFSHKDNGDDKHSHSARGICRSNKYDNAEVNDMKPLDYSHKDKYGKSYTQSSREEHNTRSAHRSSSKSKTVISEQRLQNKNNQKGKINNNYFHTELNIQVKDNERTIKVEEKIHNQERSYDRYKKDFDKGSRNDEKHLPNHQHGKKEIDNSVKIYKSNTATRESSKGKSEEGYYYRRKMELDHTLTSSKRHNVKEPGSILKAKLEEIGNCPKVTEGDGLIVIDEWTTNSVMKREPTSKEETIETENTVKSSMKNNQIEIKGEPSLNVKPDQVNQLQEKRQINGGKKSNETEFKSLSFQGKLEEINDHYDKKETIDTLTTGKRNNGTEIKPKGKLEASVKNSKKLEIKSTLAKHKSDKNNEHQEKVLITTNENNNEITIDPSLKEPDLIDKEIKTVPEMKPNPAASKEKSEEVHHRQEKKEIDTVKSDTKNSKIKQLLKPEESKKIDCHTNVKKSDNMKKKKSTDSNVNPSKEVHKKIKETPVNEDESCNVLTKCKNVKNDPILLEDISTRNSNAEKGDTNSELSKKTQENNKPSKDLEVNLNSNSDIVESVLKNNNEGSDSRDFVKSPNSDHIQKDNVLLDLKISDKRVNSTPSRRRRCVIKVVN